MSSQSSPCVNDPDSISSSSPLLCSITSITFYLQHLLRKKRKKTKEFFRRSCSPERVTTNIPKRDSGKNGFLIFSLSPPPSAVLLLLPLYCYSWMEWLKEIRHKEKAKKK
jgi:hypothetical protein